MTTLKNTTTTITQIMKGKDDGTSMTFPRFITTDGDNVWASSTTSKDVCKLNQRTNIFSKVLDSKGDGKKTKLTTPGRLAVFQWGNVSVVDSSSNHWFDIYESGNVVAVTPRPTQPYAYCSGLTYDSDRNSYSTFGYDQVVLKGLGDNKYKTLITEKGNGTHPLSMPGDVIVDQNNNVYIAGLGSNNVFKITPAGQISQIIGPNGDGKGNKLVGSGAIGLDSKGNVYVTGQDNNAFKIDTNGTITKIIDSNGDGKGNKLVLPLGLAVDTVRDDVYVSGSKSNNVFKISSDGSIEQIMDASGDGAGNKMDQPTDLVIDDNGKALYVAGSNSNNVFKIDLS